MDLINYLIPYHEQRHLPPSRPSVTVPRSPCALLQALAGHKLEHLKGQHVLTLCSARHGLGCPCSTGSWESSSPWIYLLTLNPPCVGTWDEGSRRPYSSLNSPFFSHQGVRDSIATPILPLFFHPLPPAGVFGMCPLCAKWDIGHSWEAVGAKGACPPFQGSPGRR